MLTFQVSWTLYIYMKWGITRNNQYDITALMFFGASGKQLILSLFLNIFFRTNTVTKTHAWQGLQLYILLLFTVNSNFRQC